MPVVLSLDEKLEIVLIEGESYKTYPEAAEILNNIHQGKIYTIHQQ